MIGKKFPMNIGAPFFCISFRVFLWVFHLRDRQIYKAGCTFHFTGGKCLSQGPGYSLDSSSPTKTVKFASHLKHILVGGFNPSEKYARQNGFIFPKIGVNIKIFETTT